MIEVWLNILALLVALKPEDPVMAVKSKFEK
jgi:hypothetical protein